jgi:hypothetical protein
MMPLLDLERGIGALHGERLSVRTQIGLDGTRTSSTAVPVLSRRQVGRIAHAGVGAVPDDLDVAEAAARPALLVQQQVVPDLAQAALLALEAARRVALLRGEAALQRGLGNVAGPGTQNDSARAPGVTNGDSSKRPSASARVIDVIWTPPLRYLRHAASCALQVTCGRKEKQCGCGWVSSHVP